MGLLAVSELVAQLISGRLTPPSLVVQVRFAAPLGFSAKSYSSRQRQERGHKKTRQVRQRETHPAGFMTLACALVRWLEEQD